MQTIVKNFQTVESFLEFCAADPRPETGWATEASNGMGRTRSSREVNDGKFSGVKTFGQAVDLAKGGWKEGLAMIAEKTGIITTGKARYRDHDVCGDLPDIGRFLAGSPVCMTRRRIQESTRRPIVELVLNATFSCRIKAQAIKNYGAAVATVIDELENAGFSVALKAGCSTYSRYSGGSLTVVNIVDVKKAGEAMELDRMIFFTAHPSFLRRLSFAFFENVVDHESKIDFGYGVPVELPKGEIAEDAVHFTERENGSLNSNCATMQTALEYVKRKVKQARPEIEFNA